MFPFILFQATNKKTVKADAYVAGLYLTLSFCHYYCSLCQETKMSRSVCLVQHVMSLESRDYFPRNGGSLNFSIIFTSWSEFLLSQCNSDTMDGSRSCRIQNGRGDFVIRCIVDINELNIGSLTLIIEELAEISLFAIFKTRQQSKTLLLHLSTNPFSLQATEASCGIR